MSPAREADRAPGCAEEDRSARSDLGFSQVREDPRVELELARAIAQARGGRLRVLVLCSGGCTALTLLSRPEVEVVDAIDVNPAQLHLAELRRTAIARLELDEQLLLLGITPGPGEARLALFARLQGALPAATAAFWAARPHDVAFGLHRAGRFEGLFRQLAQAFAQAGLDPLARPADVLADARWPLLFERTFERERLAETFGRAAVDYSMSRSFGAHFSHVFARALRRWTAADNPFLVQPWRDGYGDGPRPEYLGARGQAAIRALGLGPDRLRLHQGGLLDLLEPLAAEHGAYDIIQTSNITDWMPPVGLDDLVRRVRDCLRPGGALLARRLNGDHDLAEVVSRHLSVDRDRCAALAREERAFFYSEVVLGIRTPRASARPPR